MVSVEERPVGNRRSCLIGFDLPKKTKDAIQLLCLGAHSDDIEIGCGGTLLRLKRAFPGLKFHWVVFSAGGPRGREAAKAAELFTAGCEKEIVLKDYRDGFFPYHGAQLKDFFEQLKSRVNPDLIFTQWSGDAHQDHRLLSELTWNTFRNHLILEYEIPKYDGDMGRPNCFVPLEAPLSEQKIDHLFTVFESQRSKKWFDRETFRSLMRLRGMESNSPSGYAEAFHARKVVLDPVA
jgi:LmbE family N-acetylglucosaminyl deacetylase